MAEHRLDSISTKAVGFMGEALTAFLLEQEYGRNGLRVAKLGDQELPWDLYVFRPVEGAPFSRHAAIQVKARGWDSWWTYPSREEFLSLKEEARKEGCELWFSFIHYRYREGHVGFAVYLVPADDIREGDFGKKREFGKEMEMLKINDMRDRARLRFHSRKMDIEDDVEGNPGRSGGKELSGEGSGGPVSVSKDQAGDWGEDMAAFLLDSEYGRQGLGVAYIGRGYWPYDLFVDGPVDGTPFSRQAAISVKANSSESTWSKPSFGELVTQREALDAKGICLWLALLQCYYREGRLGFGFYLVDSHVLEKGDFVDSRGSMQRPDLLSFVRVRGKAVKRIWSERMGKEE